MPGDVISTAGGHRLACCNAPGHIRTESFADGSVLHTFVLADGFEYGWSCGPGATGKGAIRMGRDAPDERADE